MLREKLYESFDDVKSRRGRGGTYDFISWKNIVDRMNEVFDMNWSSEVVGEWFTDAQVLVRVRVCATNPETNETFCQEGYGGADIRGGEEAGSPHKSAYSKALKDACRKWGVGLYVEETQTSGQIQGGYTPAPNPAPQMSAPPAGPPAPTQQAPIHQEPVTQQQAPAPAPQMPPAQSAPPAQQNAPAPAPQVPATPAPTQGPPSGGFTPPPGPAQQMSPAQNIPATPAPSMTPPMPQAGGPSGGGNPGSLDEPGSITDVQNMAIKNFAKFSDGKTPDMLIQELSLNPEYGIRNNPAPTLEQLTYNEAVVVIREAKTLKR